VAGPEPAGPPPQADLRVEVEDDIHAGQEKPAVAQAIGGPGAPAAEKCSAVRGGCGVGIGEGAYPVPVGVYGAGTQRGLELVPAQEA
jgi:hypothetical protein